MSNENCPRDAEINAATVKFKSIGNKEKKNNHQSHHQNRSHFSTIEKTVRCDLGLWRWFLHILIYVKLMRCVKVACLEFAIMKKKKKCTQDEFERREKANDERKRWRTFISTCSDSELAYNRNLLWYASHHHLFSIIDFHLCFFCFFLSKPQENHSNAEQKSNNQLFIRNVAVGRF